MASRLLILGLTVGRTQMKHRFLIVDDNECAIDGIRLYLESQGYVIDYVTNGDLALAHIRQNPNRYTLIIVDFFMQPGELSGVETIREVRRINPSMLILGLSGDISVDTHNASLEAGAEAFFVKGDAIEKLYGLVRRFCDRFEEANKVVEPIQNKSENVEIIKSMGAIGCSTSLAQTGILIQKFAKIDQTVLIRGENGTGKERAARAIHDLSNRAKKPFIPVNVTALSDALFESELFGHEKGAFTGAHRSRTGKFLQAHSGTLFLDEIGDLPLDMQVKLLRALQEKEITPVGADRTIKVDVRIVAATNVDLELAVKTGRFREDLYYRLGGFQVPIKPLRDRKEDIHPLVCHFTAKYNEEHKQNKKFLHQALEYLCNYNWPGNVRELENEINRILTLAEGDRITPRDLDQKFHLSTHKESLILDHPDLLADLEDRERKFFISKLATGDSLREIAAKIKISKTTLLRRLSALGIKPKKETITV